MSASSSAMTTRRARAGWCALTPARLYVLPPYAALAALAAGPRQAGRTSRGPGSPTRVPLEVLAQEQLHLVALHVPSGELRAGDPRVRDGAFLAEQLSEQPSHLSRPCTLDVGSPNYIGALDNGKAASSPRSVPPPAAHGLTPAGPVR